MRASRFVIRRIVQSLLTLSIGWLLAQASFAQLGDPWEWSVNVIPSETYDSREEALSELQALGSQYALAEVVEDEVFGESGGVQYVAYTYGALPSDPEIGDWYDYTFQSAETNPHATEAAALASVIAWADNNTCGAVSLTNTTPWYGYQYWYSGDATKESSFWELEYIPLTAMCDQPTATSTIQAWRERDVACPQYMTWNHSQQACILNNIATIQGPPRCGVCKDDVGKGSSPSTGNQSQTEVDIDLPWITLTRSFQSQIDFPYSGLGSHWTHSHFARLDRSGGTIRGIVTSTGHQLPFKYGNAVDGSGDRVVSGPSSTKQWLRTDGSVWTFHPSNYLSQLDLPSGESYTYTYSNYRLTKITHSSGRELDFVYEEGPAYAGSLIKEIKFDDDVLVAYDYDSNGNLIEVEYPDATTREYHYEDTSFPNLLTGITDENSDRFSTYEYDDYGRVVMSTHAGDAGRVDLEFETDGSTTVTNALGLESSYEFTDDGYYRKPISIAFDGEEQTWTIPTPASDYRRRITDTVDRNGVETEYSYYSYYDYGVSAWVTRTRRTDAVGETIERIVDSYRNDNTALVIQEDAAGKTTTYAYNSRRQVTSITEEDDATSETRTTTYTYCESVGTGCPWVGLLSEIDGPRTDVSDETTFEYDSEGNLETVTNALGHETTYDSYNDHGQPTQITDPNGVVTTLSYDARFRLISQTTAGETTEFDYDDAGLLIELTLPDDSYIEYTYDNAHRLTRVDDSDGNYIEYTLDDAGNITLEETYDPTDTLTRKHYQTYNALGQLWKDIGSANTAAVTTTLSYDDNGNLTAIAAPESRSTSIVFDELNRLEQVTNPASGVTAYTYDDANNLLTVSDPKSNVTSYEYNAFGEVTEVDSPDTGVTTNTYDKAGNLATSTDALSEEAEYTYDALNRVTEIEFTDETITYTYDTGTNNKGRLMEVEDNSGSTSWTYTSAGRPASRTQVMGSVTKSLSYGYNSAGQLTSITTPSGQSIGYSYSNGRISEITVNSSTLLDGVDYEPFGPVKEWDWGNDSTVDRSYDLDGLTTAIDSAGLLEYEFDNAFRITDIDDDEDSSLTWAYGYDANDRLTSASKTGLSQTWTYDANGNRATQGGTASSTYTNDTYSNQLTGVTGATSRSYTYDSAGHTISDGTYSFGYSDSGRLTSISGGATASYEHNALGQRVKKTVSSSTTYFVYDEAGRLIGEYDASGNLIQETVWMDDIPVATLRPDGGSGIDVFYVHTDHLNTPRRITDPADDTIIWRWDSDPFGTGGADEDPDFDTNDFTYNLRFPGQYYDDETALHYNYYRDYDPVTGRYIESDPIGLNGGVNTFLYVKANPLSWSDVLGLLPDCDWHTRDSDLRRHTDREDDVLFTHTSLNFGSLEGVTLSPDLEPWDPGKFPVSPSIEIGMWLLTHEIGNRRVYVTTQLVEDRIGFCTETRTICGVDTLLRFTVEREEIHDPVRTLVAEYQYDEVVKAVRISLSISL